MKNKASVVIQKHLEPAERVLWSGQPRQGLRLRAADALLIPFSLLWGGFAFFWEYSVLAAGAPFFFPVFGIPFVAMGLYLIAGRFYIDARQRENTFYGLSSDRVLIVSGVFLVRVKSLPLRTLSDVTLIESREETGSIAFGNSFPFASWIGGMAWPGMEPSSGSRLDMIENPKQVYQLIRDAQKRAG